MPSLTYLCDNTFLARDQHGHAVLIDADSHGAPCPTELLVMALGACCSTDLVNGLQAAGARLHACELQTHETRRTQSPRLYTEIELAFTLRADGVDEATVADILAQALQRQCHVCLMLGASIRLRTRFTLHADG